MAKAEDFGIPEGTKFLDTHEYILFDEDSEVALVGISHYAAEQLGDIVYVELPDVGEQFEQGDTFGTIESVKAASDLYMPVSGTITAVNHILEEEPELVNDSCYTDGWMLEITVNKAKQLDDLMDGEGYIEYVEKAAV